MTERKKPNSRGLVVVANRLPVRRVEENGRKRWETSPGGLVAALAPILHERGGHWVGWDGTAREHDQATRGPFVHDGINIRPVSLAASEIETFYHGFSNETLWPLYHDAIRFPRFHRRWWWPYHEVNARFAEAAVEVSGPKDTVWVQDYQLQLVPGFIRQTRPNALIGFFNHIPFPPEELFAKMPWRRQVLEGMLGADVVGFQTRLSAQNFSRAARRYTTATGTDSVLEYEGRRIRVAAFPISIDFKRYADLADDPESIERAERFKRSFDNRRIFLGVDRLDYTKGIDTRLRAYEELLKRGRLSVEDVVFVQVAVPSREAVDDYAELRRSVNEHVGRINGTYAELGNIAVHYIYRGLPMHELIACYRAADAMVVTPFRDGMNLVCKEFVAARTDNTGSLVLSEFAGAALELKQAILVNPYDIDGMAAAMEAAMSIDPQDARRRMTAMRRTVQKNDVYAWSDSFLEYLAG